LPYIVQTHKMVLILSLTVKTEKKPL